MPTPPHLAPFLSAVPHVPPEVVAGALAAEFGLAGELAPLPGEHDQNLRLDGAAGRFVVKVANPTGERATIELQQAALEHISRIGAEVAVPRPLPTRDDRPVALVTHDGAEHLMWVQSWLPGTPLREGPPDAVSRAEVAATVARLQRALQGFHHPAAGRRLLWDLREFAAAEIPAVGEPALDERIAAVLDRIRRSVLPRLAALPAQIIHHDLNPDNLLTDGGAVTGVVDFGDLVHGPRIADLAVAAAYQTFGTDDPATALVEMVRGFPPELSGAEVELLADLVAGRLCQTIAIGAWHASHQPGNAEYVLGDAAPARRALAGLEATHAATLTRRLLDAAGIRRPPADLDGTGLSGARSRSLASGLRLSYRRPLHLVAGDGVWVEAADGRRYLDAYNNVVQAGHGHPLIAGALAAQTRRLNTNTRYLTDAVVHYAARLTGLLPGGLDVCFLTTSGSEANDLALRIARTLAGADGVIVTEHAYHGSTTATMAISPEETGVAQLGDYVATIAPPRHEATAEVAGALDRLDRAGHAPAALIVDTIFSSDGIFDPPGGYLDGAAAAVRARGGLYIADEVQAGLGRVGRRFWGFAAGSAVPDVVTLGKPLGGGYPMGAVVTTRAIADAFADQGYYFSTFGGNTVAAAVGSAVLDVTHDEDLAERAEQTGELLRAGLRDLAADHPQLGAVRGAGLFVGVEVVAADGGPDGAAAEALVEAMKEAGVLIGRTGPAGNVLKIRPPLVFGENHVALLLDALAVEIAPLRAGPAQL